MNDDLDPRTPEEWEALRRAGARVVELALARPGQLRSERCWQPPSAAVLDQLGSLPPRQGIGIEAALARAEQLLPYGTGNTHPRFWGFVMGAGNLPGMIGQWLAGSMNANLWAGDQALARLEQHVIEWFRAWFEFPASASGILLEGASSATLSALAIARHRATDGRDKREGLRNGLRCACTPPTPRTTRCAKPSSCLALAPMRCGSCRRSPTVAPTYERSNNSFVMIAPLV